MYSPQTPWKQRLRLNFSRIIRWLKPGLGVKRWLIMIVAGTTMLGVGFAIYVLDFYRTAPETWWLPYLSFASLRFLARPLRAVIFGGLGVGLVVGGIWGLNRALLAPFIQPGKPIIDTLSGYRRRGRGSRVVTIGGGHGLSTLLRGLKEYTRNITAVVTVADDGGSSGRLRESMGILPPGDIRNCLAALSNDEAMLAQLFQYRFADGNGGLEGHSFGNLFISALSEITGSFEAAVAESGRVLSVSGRVLPSTLHDVRLVADLSLPHTMNEVRVKGESRFPQHAGEVRRVWLEPNSPPAYPEVIQALLRADMIVLGPGSLFTSILPNLLVPDIAAAVRSSQALKIYVCNVASQPGETDGYSCGDHMRTLETHLGQGMFDLVVANDNFNGELPEDTAWVVAEKGLERDYSIHLSDVSSQDEPGRHDAKKLNRVLIDLLQDRTGPLIFEE